MELLAPWSLVGLVLVPAIFLWGLWAPRGQRLVVGSLLLWRRVVGTGPTGRPSPRLRLRNPLLWLDAAAVTLVVLACARPALHRSVAESPVATIVIDRTASLLTDLGQGPRWERARAMAAPLLKELGAEPVRVACVPDATGEVSSALVPSADGIEAVTWTPVLAARDAWDTAASEAARDPDRPVLVVTDMASARPMPKNVFVVGTGGESRNLGLVRAATRVEAGRWWLLVSARAGAMAHGPCGLEVSTAGGRSLLREPKFLAAGESVERVFQMSGSPETDVHVSLTAAAGAPLDDGFAADNDAYLAWSPSRPIRVVMIGDPAEAVQRAMAARADTSVYQAADPSRVKPTDADLVLACGAALPAEWKGPAILVMPPAGAGPVTPLAGEAEAEWKVVPAHPLAGALYLEPPRLGRVRPYRLEPGAQLLLGTPDVPLAATWEAGGHKRLAILFPLDPKTNPWPRLAGFPVFWRHALDWLAPETGRTGGHATCLPFEVPPGATRPAPGTPGFYPAEGGRRLAVSFIGTDEGWQAGAGRDDSKPALAAIRAALSGRQRDASREIWPWLAAAVLALVLARAWVGR